MAIITMMILAIIKRRRGEPVVAQGKEWSTEGNSEPSQVGQVLSKQFQNGLILPKIYQCGLLAFLFL